MFLPPAGKPVMIITEYMENGSLDTFLKVEQQRGEWLPWQFQWFSTAGVSGPTFIYSTKIRRYPTFY